MPDVQGQKKTRLRPGDTKVGYTLKVESASTATANDGYIPYGTTVSGVTSTVYDEDGNAVTADIVYAVSTISAQSGYDEVKIEFQYPSTNGDGRYTLKHALTLSDGGTLDLYYSRIYAETII